MKRFISKAARLKSEPDRCGGAISPRWGRVVILLGCWLLVIGNIGMADNDLATQTNSGTWEAAAEAETAESSEAKLIRRRVQTVANICGGLLGVIVVALIYFRLNHATRGVYSRRLLMFALLFGTLVVILCVVSLMMLWQ